MINRAGVCDTHMHFYDDRFPTSPEAVLRPSILIDNPAELYNFPSLEDLP